MTSEIEPPAAPVDTNVLLEFMYRLAQALLASGEQTSQVNCSCAALRPRTACGGHEL
jgi:hypothetical protein